MKNSCLFLLLTFFLFSCSESNDLLVETSVDDSHLTNRLNFSDESSLQKAIELGQSSNSGSSVKSIGSKKFISMLEKMPSAKNTGGEEISYYEALGFDTLVPNQDFAALLNIKGELEVGNEIIRITPVGTYRFPIEAEKEFNKLIEEKPDYLGTQIDEETYKISDNIILYKTFEQKPDDYSILSEGNYELLPDDFFGDEPTITNMETKAVSEPNFDSFQTFSADRQTWFGKLIQNIIGSTKESTVNFSSKRRVKGSFYFYNYGVYAEIGVQGWTDKKNWIGWSKTESDELRVGWNKVVLKKTIPDYYKQSLNDLNSIIYYPPQYMEVHGRRVNVATLAMPDYKSTLKDKVVAQGVKAIYNYLKSDLGRPATEWERAEAFIIASRTELYYISGTEHVVKWNTKSYTHVFANSWMTIVVGWNNQSGIFLNNLNPNNYNKAGAWLQTIGKAFNEQRSTLESGEVYTCARFGNDWRGMKIVKQ